MSFTSPAQRVAAAQRSIEVRGARATVKRDLAAMAPADARELAAQTIEDPDDVLRPMGIMAVLCAIPKVGPDRAASYLRRARVRDATLGALTLRERMSLAALLREPRPCERAA